MKKNSGINLFKMIPILFIIVGNVSAEDLKKIERFTFKKQSPHKIIVEINHDGPLDQAPELLIRDKMIQVSMPGSYVWPKITKKFSLNNEFDTTFMAYQFNKDVVRFRAILPYNIENKKDLVQLTIKDSKTILEFPYTEQVGSQPERQVVKNKNNGYDESYLDRLLSDKKVFDNLKPVDLKVAKNDFENNNKKLKDDFSAVRPQQKVVMSDKVKMQLAATEKPETSLLNEYIGKFLAFMGIVIVAILGFFKVIKKGVLRKGKLGFLNNTKIVEVLNTTYIAPKKSLMLVKVNKQIFLLASSDKGLDFLTEVDEPTSLLKNGELGVSGSNFDTSINNADQKKKEFKLKEILSSSEGQIFPASQNNLDTEVAAKVKLSDQIKKKVKGLKALQ